MARSALPLLSALIFFGFLAYPGLTMAFAPDDVMNIHAYWSKSWVQLLRGLLLIDPGFYRPLGSLFYLPIFGIFSLRPEPYRIVIFVLLCANVWLLYCLVRQLTGSRTAAALGALSGSYHASAIAVYLSTAMVYDVLCLTFMLAGTVFYIRVRKQGRVLEWRETAVLLVLYIAALDAKEMAVVFPVVLAVYELAAREWKNQRSRVAAPLVAAFVIAAYYAAGKLAAPGNLTGVESYHPEWTLHQYMRTTRYYGGLLFFKGDLLSSRQAIALWLGVFAVAALLKRRDMLFGAAFAFLTFLPLNFMPFRDGYAIYIPLAGFGIWLGGLFAALTDAIRPAIRSAAFALCVAALLLVQYPQARYLGGGMRNAQEMTSRVIRDFRALDRPRAGSSMLIRGGPFGDYWDMYFIAKLTFRDPTLRVSITTEGFPQPRGDAHGEFDRIVAWRDNQLVVER